MLKKALRPIVNATLLNTLAELNISQTTVAYFRPKKLKTSSPKPSYIKQKAMKLMFIILGWEGGINRQLPFFTKSCARVFGLWCTLACSGFCKKNTLLQEFERN